MVYLINNSLDFPSTHDLVNSLYPDDLVGVGERISPELLISAYRLGVFPWYNDFPVLWFFPSPRTVLFTDKFKCSKSLLKELRNERWSVSFNREFNLVINYCAQIDRKGQDGTWINDDIINNYSILFKQEKAFSVEVYFDGVIAGGLYGIQLGKMFYGESMFSLKSNSSKIALATLTYYLNLNGIKLIDCQQKTNHLLSLGAEEVSKKVFSNLLIEEQNKKTIDLKTIEIDLNSVFKYYQSQSTGNGNKQ